jgi:hypothetical protein
MNKDHLTLTDTAKLFINDKEFDLPTTVGSEDEVGIDISQ